MRPPDPLRSPPSSRRRDQTGLRRLLAGLAGDRAGQLANAILGPTHPLTRASDTVRSIAGQWLICASILTGSVIAEAENHPWATPLLGSSAAVLLVLTALLIVFRQRVCDCAIELIAEGRETLPIAVVQRQARARGVALVERLMTDGRSPLYGQEAAVLRQELRRVQDAL